MKIETSEIILPNVQQAIASMTEHELKIADCRHEWAQLGWQADERTGGYYNRRVYFCPKCDGVSFGKWV